MALTTIYGDTAQWVTHPHTPQMRTALGLIKRKKHKKPCLSSAGEGSLEPRKMMLCYKQHTKGQSVSLLARRRSSSTKQGGLGRSAGEARPGGRRLQWAAGSVQRPPADPPQLPPYHLPQPWHPAPTGRCEGAETLALGQRETPPQKHHRGSLQQVLESSSEKYKRASQLSLRQTENATGTTSAQTNCWNTPHDTEQA